MIYQLPPEDTIENVTASTANRMPSLGPYPEEREVLSSGLYMKVALFCQPQDPLLAEERGEPCGYNYGALCSAREAASWPSASSSSPQRQGPNMKNGLPRQKGRRLSNVVVV